MTRQTLNDVEIPGKKIARIVGFIFMIGTYILCRRYTRHPDTIPEWTIWVGVGGSILTIGYIIGAILYTGQGKTHSNLIIRLVLAIVLFLLIAAIAIWL